MKNNQLSELQVWYLEWAERLGFTPDLSYPVDYPDSCRTWLSRLEQENNPAKKEGAENGKCHRNIN